jgi:hypothetical protein
MAKSEKAGVNPPPVYTHRCPIKSDLILAPAACWGRTDPECQGCQWTERPVEIKKVRIAYE